MFEYKVENNEQKDPTIIELGNRIKRAVEFSGKNQVEFASLMGVPPSSLNRWIKGGGAPSFENLSEIGRLSGVSFDWLMTGEGDIQKFPCRVTDVAATWEINSEFISIPQVSGKLGAGQGIIADDAIEMRVAFRREWISRKGDPHQMKLIRVKGDSMEPTLFHGDLVLVDFTRKYIDPSGGIYAIAIGDEMVAKRLDVDPTTQKIRIISDNPKSPPIEVDSDQLHINGKIIWVARELER